MKKLTAQAYPFFIAELGRRAKRNPVLIWERKGNPSMNFLMVIMDSGIARGRVRTTTTATESAAILQIIGWQRHAALVYRLLLWYWAFMLWSIDTCQNKVSVSRDHIAGLSVQLIEVTWFLLKLTADQVLVFVWIAGSCQVNLLIENRAGAGLCGSLLTLPRIKIYSNYNFFFYTNVFLLLWFEYMVIIKLKTESQTVNRKPHRKSTFCLFLG